MADLYLRHANRYEVTAPVSYWWSSPKGPVHSAAGETRNISHSGVLVAAGECPPIGSAIQMTIQLPRLRGGGFGMKLQGEGMVLRIENAGTTTESKPVSVFAASVMFYFETSEKSEQPDVSGDEKLKTTVQ